MRMMEWILKWLVDTVLKQVVVLLLGLVLGYLIHSAKSRIRVTITTHIEQTLSDRRINVGIRNYGDVPVVVDSWTVHIPGSDVFPFLEGLETCEKAPPPKRWRLSRLRRFAVRILGRISRGSRIESGNYLAEFMAQSQLGALDLKHQLLPPGTTVTIGSGESVVRQFPLHGDLQGMLSYTSEIKILTIIPSCHIYGRRRRVWGMASIISAGGVIPFSAGFRNPDPC